MLLLSDGSELEVVAAAGEQPEDLVGRRAPDADTWLNDLQAEVPDLRGLPTLVSSLELRGRPRGLLVAMGPRAGGFDASDENVFSSFAAAAATTIVTVQAVEAEKLQLSIEASERERQRWARELHDETLQELGALRVLLEASGRKEGQQPSPKERRLATVSAGKSPSEHQPGGVQPLVRRSGGRDDRLALRRELDLRGAGRARSRWRRSTASYQYGAHTPSRRARSGRPVQHRRR